MISYVFCKLHLSVLKYGCKLLDIQCLSIYFIYLYVYYNHVTCIISNIGGGKYFMKPFNDRTVMESQKSAILCEEESIKTVIQRSLTGTVSCY